MDIQNKIAVKNVIVLSTAQALISSLLPMHFISVGLAGSSLSENLCLATMPISMIIIGSKICAPLLSNFV